MREIRERGSYLIADEQDGELIVTYASPQICAELDRDMCELIGMEPVKALRGRGCTKTLLPDGSVLILPDDGESEDRLLQMNFELQHALEAKSSFLSNMSHDIRTPMNAIIGMTNIAQNHLDEKTRVQDCLNKIQTAASHLMSLINDVLEMSRIDSGKVFVNEERFSLADLVHDLTVLLRPLSAQKEQQFLINVGMIPNEALMGDTLYLRQIFVNIINNAIKYTENGGCIRMGFDELSTDDPHQITLVFTCKDNGIGMSADFVKRIFIPFERAENTTMSKIEGTGLGMAITKRLIELMGGHIEVESELGVGSLFTVSIPLSVDNEKVSLADLSGKTVFVVAHDDLQLGAVMGHLTEAGASAEELPNEDEAITRITEYQYEGKLPYAVLLGDKLSDNAAFDLAAHLRNQLGGEVPILLVSERDWSRIEYTARRAGITGFVPCPVFRDKLLKSLYGGDEEKISEKEDFSGMCILLAEDNELNREIAVEMLADTGAQVDAVEDGKQALEAFEASEEGYYQLILMDIQMPVMDGYEAVRRIRALDRKDASEVCIAAMTANAFVEDIKKSRAAGMNEHLSKPVDTEQVEDLMRRCFAQRCGEE